MKKKLHTFLKKNPSDLLFDTPIGGQWVLFDYFKDRNSVIDVHDYEILMALLPRMAIYPGDGNYSQYSKSQYVYEKIAKVNNTFPQKGLELWNAMITSPYLRRREVQFYNLFTYYEHRQGCESWERTCWQLMNWYVEPEVWCHVSDNLLRYFALHTTEQDTIDVVMHNIPHILVFEHVMKKGLSRLFSTDNKNHVYQKYIENITHAYDEGDQKVTMMLNYMSEVTPPTIVAYVHWLLGQPYNIEALPLALMRESKNRGDREWLLDFIFDVNTSSLTSEIPLMV